MGGYGYVLADTASLTPGQIIFEAGSTFGRESSTSYLQRIAARTGARFVTADLFAEGVDAVDFITRHWPGGTIGFAYLDSWDWPYHNMNPHVLDAQRRQYAALGRDLTEDASAAHHLALAQQVHAHAADGCILAIDDTWATNDGCNGKGRDAIPWLLDHGWHLHAQHVDGWVGGDTANTASGMNAFYIAVRKQTERTTRRAAA